MAEYSRLAKGSFTNTAVAGAAPTAAFVNLPFIPDYVELWNYTNIKTAGTHRITRAWWDNKILDGANNPTMVELYAASATATMFDTIQTNGISAFAAGQLLQYGPVQQHGGGIGDFSITAASPAVVTTTNAHNLVSGNVIVFSNLYQTSTTGMQQMAGVPMTVTYVSSTSFSVNWNASGSNYTAFNTATSTGNVGSYKQVLYPYLYCPEQTVITGINRSLNDQFTGAANTIQTAAAHNFQVGQEVAFRIPTAWGSTQINSLPDIPIPGSPIYFYVIAVTQNTFTVSVSLANITAFNPNQTFLGFIGLKMPQVVPAGDVNTGGAVITAGSPLYPSPQVYSGFTNTTAPTINGPAIQGAFINNTSQGFVIGPGAAAIDTATTSFLSATTTNIVYWHAYQHDLALP